MPQNSDNRTQLIGFAAQPLTNIKGPQANPQRIPRLPGLNRFEGS